MTITDKQVEAACVAFYGEFQWKNTHASIRREWATTMRAALEAAEAARDEDDFVLAPREMTEEMMDASESAAWATRDQLGRDASFDAYIHAYVQAQWRAALKASPKYAAPSGAEPRNIDDAVTAALHRPPNGQAGESTDYCRGWHDACAYIHERRSPASAAPEADERYQIGEWGDCRGGGPEPMPIPGAATSEDVGALIKQMRGFIEAFPEAEFERGVMHTDKQNLATAIDNLEHTVEVLESLTARAQSSAAPVSEQAGPPSAEIWAAVWAARELGEVRDAAEAEHYTDDGDVIIERPSWERLLDALDKLPDWYADGPQMPPVSARAQIAAWHAEDGRVISAAQKAEATPGAGVFAASAYSTPSYFLPAGIAPVSARDADLIRTLLTALRAYHAVGAGILGVPCVTDASTQAAAAIRAAKELGYV